MLLLETTFPDIKGRMDGPVGTGVAPDDWWTYGVREERYQSWERPFMLTLVAVRNQDMSGARIVVDTGEALVWHDVASMADLLPGFREMFSPGPLESLIGAQVGLPPSMLAMPAMPDIKAPVPHTGREERRFAGVSDYLREIAVETTRAPDGRAAGLSLVREQLVGGDPAERERAGFSEQRSAWETMGRRIGGGSEFRLLSVMDRTVMQTWLVDTPDGGRKILVVGAEMAGREVTCYQPGRAPQVAAPRRFGASGLEPGATYHEVMWMARQRFCGLCDEGEVDVAELEQAVAQVGTRARFSQALMDEMEAQRKAMSDADLDDTRRDTEELRRLGREMREDARNRDRVREWEDARRRERQQESERRIRDGWSAVIRGVDRYVAPGGRILEVPVAGPGYRAWYDPLSGTVLHTDRPPIGWEELPRYTP